MIARTWTGRVPHAHADRFEKHLRATGAAEAARISGRRDAQILRTDVGDAVEFRLVTYWDTLAAIRMFAGDDIERAVAVPGRRGVSTRSGTARRGRRVVVPRAGAVEQLEAAWQAVHTTSPEAGIVALERARRS